MSDKTKTFQGIILPAIILGLICGLSFNVFSQTKLPASSIKTIYITPLSHYDFGFVEPPDQIRERAVRHIDEVLRVAESNPNFKWTIESVWQLNEWIKKQRKPASVLPKDTAKINRLMKLIKSGQIMLSTSWGSMHTDFMGAEELNRLVYDYAKFEKTYGVRSETALLNDVPGHPTSIPSILGGSDTKYLVVGANCFINNATSLAPGKVPFYWQSPDGNKVLTWVSQGKRGGYVEGLTDYYLDPFTLDPYTDKTPFDMFNPELAGKKTPMEVMEIGVTELLNRYNAGGYKYDAVMALFAHDFIEPTNVANLEKAAKLWNAKHKEVQFKIATPNEFFKYIETKYSSQIPTFKGEWSGLWSEAKTQSPKISALARYNHDQIPAAETLWSAITITRNIPYPVGNFSSLYDAILTYDEHSGAGNTGWIQLNSRQPLEEQNRQYVGFMSKAKNEVDYMNRQGLSLLAQPSKYDNVPTQKTSNSWNLMVYNGLSWNRNDLVKISSPKENVRVTAVKDLATNQKVDFDIDDQGQILFVAKDVPPMGYKSFEITTETGSNASTLKSSDNAREFSRKNFSVKVRADGNIESIKDVRLNREIVNNNGERPFNDLLRNEGADASKIPYPISPKITVKKGEQMTQIEILRERSTFPKTIVTVFDDLDQVEIHNELSSELMFPGGDNNWNDSYYFAFPFNVSKQNLKVKRGGQKWFDTLPDDYLPGARTDSVTTQHLIAMTDGNSSAMVAHRQAFHWVYSSYVATQVKPQGSPKDFPALYTGKFPLPEATIYSRAIRKSVQADTNDLGVVNLENLEPGLNGNYVFDYAISADGKFDDFKAWRFGANFNLPLRTQYVDVLPKNQTASYFSVNQPNVQIVTVKAVSESVNHGEVGATPLNPQINKKFVIRLQEFTGKATTTQINLPAKIKSATVTNLTESRVLQNISQISPLTVELKPFETKTIKIEIE
ncbi:MAG: glycosyl hydrolase-related protein [Acidobacteriota bacterium]